MSRQKTPNKASRPAVINHQQGLFQALAHLAAAELLRQALGRDRLARLAELPPGPVRARGRGSAPRPGREGSPPPLHPTGRGRRPRTPLPRSPVRPRSRALRARRARPRAERAGKTGDS